MGVKEPPFFGMGASKNTVWGMAAYDLRGMEDGNFYRLKCRIAMENERIPLNAYSVKFGSNTTRRSRVVFEPNFTLA